MRNLEYKILILVISMGFSIVYSQNDKAKKIDELMTYCYNNNIELL